MRVRVIPEYPGFVVSDNGQVQGPSGKWLNGSVGRGGYLQISVGGRSSQRSVRTHVMVCTAFHGPRPAGQEVRHLNGNRQDNRADNLVWGTRAQNMEDARAHGTLTRGSASPRTDLTDDDVRHIRSSSRTGRELAAYHGVSPMTISRVINRKTWRHLDV